MCTSDQSTQVWQAAKTRDKYKLFLKDKDKASIQEKLPRAKDGNYYADAVFEGGGVKGTAFLGALRCFDDAGIKFRKVAGTSAGAITAALLAAEFSIEELEAIIGELDYTKEFLNRKTSPFIFNGCPEDDLASFPWMIFHLLMNFQKGQYSSEPFKEWLDKLLEGKERSDFKLFLEEQQAGREWYQRRDLRVVVSDISRREMRVLPDDLKDYGLEPNTFSVAEAVRLSMSIPLFFEPGELNGSTIVDGGVLSNFPLWIYDAKPGDMPLCPTFGFRLVEPDKEPKPVRGVLNLLLNMMQTMQTARDRHHLRLNGQGRVIEIGTLGVSTTKFNLTNEDKEDLYREGYEKTKGFLLEDWSWEEHLEARGVSVGQS